MEGNIHEPSPLETAVRRLYALPLAEFVTARNDLAKQVKGGDREAWLRVKALPKASVTAWAVNQLFAREEEKMRRLLGLGERVRRLAAEEGEGLREALEEERALRERLADPDNRIRAGIDLFNDSEGRQSVNALSRTLGRPEVHVDLGDGDQPPALISFTWRGVTWQTYAADPNPAVAEPRVYLTDSGEDLSGVDREPPNARLGPGGRVALGL